MSTSEFMKIAQWSIAAHAQHAQAVLGWNEIDSHVDGADLGGMGSAISGVSLRVPREDAERAVKVLEQYSSYDPGTRPGPWFCGTCEEEVDEGFDLCWSCGEPREEVEAEFPALADFAAEPTGTDTTDPANADLPERSSLDEHNPYAPPVVGETVEVEEQDKSAIQEEAEQFVVRASNAAVLGLVVPVVGTLYSLSMLYEAFCRSRSYSGKQWRLILITLAFDFVIALMWAVVLLWMSTPRDYIMKTW